jgi:sucrose-6-phosphate hydrolase SacC (GH32 family)
MNFSEKSSQFVFQKKNSLEFFLGKSIEIFLEIFLDKKVLEFFIKKKVSKLFVKKKTKVFLKIYFEKFPKTILKIILADKSC